MGYGEKKGAKPIAIARRHSLDPLCNGVNPVMRKQLVDPFLLDSRVRGNDEVLIFRHSHENGNLVNYQSAMKKGGYVYMMASDRNGTLYVGITSDLAKRVYEHKTKTFKGFTEKYSINNLVWFEEHDAIESAIYREKQLKKWNRAWKIELIEKDNPSWNDLISGIL